MDNWIDELERLAKLRDDGILNQTEFESQKQRILSELNNDVSDDPETEAEFALPDSEGNLSADEESKSVFPQISKSSLTLGSPNLNFEATKEAKGVAILLIVALVIVGVVLGTRGGGNKSSLAGLAETIGASIEENNIVGIECNTIKVDPPEYLTGSKESGVCDDFIIVKYDSEQNPGWTRDFYDFAYAQGSFNCRFSDTSVKIFFAWSESRDFGIWADSRIAAINFEKVARAVKAEKASYYFCSDEELREIYSN